MKLDIKDKKILFELEKDARQSNSSIAKSVGLSKDSIGYRIKQLENKGLIRGYRTMVNVGKLGYTLYRIYFRWIDTSQSELNKIIEFLKKEKNAWWIAKLDGSWDFVFAYWSKTPKDFYDFYQSFSKHFRKYIKDKLICPLISYNELPRKYLTDLDSKVKIEISEKIEKVDEVDLRILKMLSQNARIPLMEIAGKLKLDNMTIYHRIKKLEVKKIISGYKLDIDVGKLERDFYTVHIDLKNFSQIEKLREEIFSLKELTAWVISIGGNDIEFDLEIENTQDYYKIINSLKDKFSEIREIRYFRVIENYKILYMPEE